MLEEKITSEVLSGNPLGDPVTRDVNIIEISPKPRSPVLIGLAGFTGSGRSFLNRSFTALDFITALKDIEQKRIDHGFILILPDVMTGLYGNQYLNSAAVGDYEDYIVKEIVGFVRERYGERAMALFGKSSGGFGSYTLAVRHPDIFSGFIDVSGDSCFEYEYIPDFPDTYKEIHKYGIYRWYDEIHRKLSLQNQDIKVANIVAMSAFYSPDSGSPMGISFPFDLETGEFNESVWSRWLRFDPARNIDEYMDVLKDMAVFLQAGIRDEFHADIGIGVMHRKLERENVVHFYELYDSGHFGIDYFYLKSMPLLLELIEQ
ncbi:alpha/beta hydrolase [Thermoplasma sp. Kam2015]|uniref:alpha/beta hydrolase n=1 Tax=Thermoplasma sp. Kam2015 TaxID=2094122 RepID=UPI001F3405B3|nr:alpha/beta hydrolase [Thermoplasma sp. Kam2015]